METLACVSVLGRMVGDVFHGHDKREHAGVIGDGIGHNLYSDLQVKL